MYYLIVACVGSILVRRRDELPAGGLLRRRRLCDIYQHTVSANVTLAGQVAVPLLSVCLSVMLLTLVQSRLPSSAVRSALSDFDIFFKEMFLR